MSFNSIKNDLLKFAMEVSLNTLITVVSIIKFRVTLVLTESIESDTISASEITLEATSGSKFL